MFWKKKQVAPPTAKVEAQPKAKVEKLPGPKEIPELVGRYMVVQDKKDPDWVWKLKAVVRNNPRGKKVFDVRVFDEAQVAQKGVKVKDWATFDEHPDLILYEGWFDKESMQVELEEKKTAEANRQI